MSLLWDLYTCGLDEDEITFHVQLGKKTSYGSHTQHFIATCFLSMKGIFQRGTTSKNEIS